MSGKWKFPLLALLTAWIVSVLLWCGVSLQQRGVYVLGWEAYPIPPADVTLKDNLGAHAYQTLIPGFFQETIQKSGRPLLIFENGTPLPIYREDQVGRYRVGREGAGYFLIQNRQVFFSATDNSDPRSNGKTYELRVPRPVEPWMQVRLGFAVLLLSAGLLGLVIVSGRLKQLGKITLLVVFNLALLCALLAGFEIFLRRAAGEESEKKTGPSQRLPYDSNYARNDLTYYRPDEILDESQGLYTWGYLVKNNTFGFREREITLPKPPATLRVMVLGDSLTFGVGLDVSERYTNLAEKYLQGSIQGKKIEVLNFGKPGADLDDELVVLQEFKDRVRPDLIVIGFCGNDLMTNVDLYQIRKKQFESQYGSAVDYFTNALRRVGLNQTALKFRAALDGFLIRAGVLPDVDYASQQLLSTDTMEVKRYLENLKKVKQISDGMGLPAPIFTVLSVQAGLPEATDYRDLSASLPLQLRIYHKAEQLAQEAGFFHYNHEQEILDRPPASMRINDVDDHPSAELNQIYAAKLSKLLKSYFKDN